MPQPRILAILAFAEADFSLVAAALDSTSSDGSVNGKNEDGTAC